MTTKELVVRIIEPSRKPFIPEINAKIKRQSKNLLGKAFNILSGSAIGIFAGILIFFMLKGLGMNFSTLESSLIIGLPSMLGILTSLVIF